MVADQLYRLAMELAAILKGYALSSQMRGDCVISGRYDGSALCRSTNQRAIRGKAVHRIGTA